MLTIHCTNDSYMLVIVMGVSSHSQQYQLYYGGQFYCWRNESIRGKQVTGKLYLIRLYQEHLAMSGMQTCNITADNYCLQ